MKIKFDAIDTGFKYTTIQIRQTNFVRTEYAVDIKKYSDTYLTKLYQFFTYLKEKEFYSFLRPTEDMKCIRHFICDGDFPDSHIIKLSLVLEGVLYFILSKNTFHSGSLLTTGIKEKIFTNKFDLNYFCERGNIVLGMLGGNNPNTSITSYIEEHPPKSSKAYTQVVFPPKDKFKLVWS